MRNEKRFHSGLRPAAEWPEGTLTIAPTARLLIVSQQGLTQPAAVPYSSYKIVKEILR